MADWSPANVEYTYWEWPWLGGEVQGIWNQNANYQDYLDSPYYEAGWSYKQYLDWILVQEKGESWWQDTAWLEENIGQYNYPYVYELYQEYLASASSGDESTGSDTGGTTGSGIYFLNESPTYFWGKVGTVWNCVGTPVPLVYGRHKIGGRVIQNFTRKIGNDDYLFILLLLSEGEIESVSDIKINDVEISKYGDAVEYWIRKGTPDQDPIEYFKDIVVQNYLTGEQSITTSAYTYTIENDQTDKAIVRLYFPYGLYKRNADGSYETATVNVVINGTTYTITEMKSLPFYYDIHIENVGSEITIYRTNEETIGEVGDGTYLWDKVVLSSVQEIQYSNENYANLALLGLKIKATDDLYGDMPEISCIVKGIKVKNLKTGIYEYNTNPAYIIYDILINERYGAGAYVDINTIDEQSFIDAADYYDELVNDGKGGQEKRFEFNLVLDEFYRATDLLGALAEMVNSKLLFYNKKIKLVPKKEKTSPAYLFTEGNIKANTINWNLLSKNTRYKSAVITFFNSEDNYEKYTITVPFDNEAELKPDIAKTLIGLTKQSQAIRYARLLLRSYNYRNLTVSFEALGDAIHLEPGDLIYVGHKAQGQLQTGNITGFADDYVLLDNAYNFEAGKNYEITLLLENDEIVTIQVVPFSTDKKTNIVKLATSFTDLGNNPRKLSPYSLALSGQSYEKYTITQVVKKSNLSVEISALKYDDNVYYNLDDFNVNDYQSYKAIVNKTIPESVENLTLKEEIIQNPDGSYRTDLIISFSRPDDYKWDGAYLQFYYDYDKYPYIYYTLAKSYGYYVMQNAPVGNLIAVRAQSISVDGIREPLDTAPIATKIIVGFHKIPDDVEGFQAIQQGNYVLLKWKFNTDAVSKYYEIRKGTSWESGKVLVENLTTNEYRDFEIFNGTQKYFIKAKTTTGLYSEHATSAVVNVSGIPLQNIIYDDEERPEWNGTKFGLKRVYSDNEGTYILRSSHIDYKWSDVYADGELWTDRTQTTETWYQFEDVIYYITNTYDIGKKWLCRLFLEFDIDYFVDNGLWIDYYQLNDTWGNAFDTANERWIRIERPEALKIYVSFSDDNITWSDWQEFTNGTQYEFRYVRFKFEFQQKHLRNYVEINNIHQIFDVDDVIIRLTNFKIDVGGTTIFYTNYKDTKGRDGNFLYPPYFVGITILDTNKGLFPVVTDKTDTSLTITAYNSSDTSESAVADIMIHGY